MFRVLTVAAAAAFLATGAHAQSLNATFDNLNGGASALNYTGFPNFTVAGNVDLVKSGDYGIACAGGTGSCVDLDGTPGPGSITTNALSFAAGALINVSFQVSGNQRDAGPDTFNFTSTFSSPTTYSFTCGTGFTTCNSGVYSGTTASYPESIAGNRGFTTYSYSFTPTTAGSFQLTFGTTSADNVGPILDNVVAQAVPEVATWAMMILGFGMVGGALRSRRRTAVRFA